MLARLVSGAPVALEVELSVVVVVTVGGVAVLGGIAPAEMVAPASGMIAGGATGALASVTVGSVTAGAVTGGAVTGGAVATDIVWSVELRTVATGAGVAGRVSAGAGAVTAGSAAGSVTSVDAAPRPNCAGSTPTLLSTTGAWGAAACVVAGAGVELRGIRSTWLLTTGTLRVRAARCAGCATISGRNGATADAGRTFRGDGTRSPGNWSVGATTGASAWIRGGGWSSTARTRGTV